MTQRTPAKKALVIAALSPIFTLCIWGWIFSRPAGTFHEQGHMAIMYIYLPATFWVWVICACLSAIVFFFARRRCKSEAELLELKKLRRIKTAIVALGLLLAIGTFFTA